MRAMRAYLGAEDFRREDLPEVQERPMEPATREETETKYYGGLSDGVVEYIE